MDRRQVLARVGGTVVAVSGGWFVLTDRAVRYDVDLEFASDHGPDSDSESEDTVAVDVTLRSDTVGPFDPAVIDLSIENVSSHAVSVYSGAPGPFGVLEAVGEGNRITLWSDAYAETQHVTTIGGVVLGGNDIAVGTPLEPGDVVTRAYELRRRSRGLVPGEYTVSNSVVVESSPAVDTDDDEQGIESQGVSYEFTITVST